MPVKTHHRKKNSPQTKTGAKPARRETEAGILEKVEPNKTVVPFHVTAFAASIFQPPAISDAVEDEPLFDRAKAQRVVKSKKK